MAETRYPSLCPECKEIRRSDKHRCHPLWQCRFEDCTDDFDDFEPVRARSSEEAAEKFTEDHEPHDDLGDIPVLVRKIGETNVERFRVVREMSIEYTAHPEG